MPGTRSRAVLRVDEAGLPRLARALDHLRNANPDDFDSPDTVGPATRALSAARDGCRHRLDTKPIFYLVRRQGVDHVFWSYSGPNAAGDRLVYYSGEAHTVLAVAPDERHFDGVLVVSRVPADATADPDQD